LSLALPSTADVLPLTIALFKTPSLGDLGHSSPYLHTGRMNSIEEVIQFYQNFSDKARAGDVRNAAPELRDMALDDSAAAPLAAFLRSLDEDYTD
jgi:cytochrome c peroxidase